VVTGYHPDHLGTIHQRTGDAGGQLGDPLVASSGDVTHPGGPRTADDSGATRPQPLDRRGPAGRWQV